MTDLPADLPAVIDAEIHIVDVAAPYAKLSDDAYLAAFGQDRVSPDWRIQITFRDGSEVTMHADADADDAALFAIEHGQGRGVPSV